MLLEGTMDLIIIIVINEHSVCPIVIPCFHVPEAYGWIQK